MNSLIYERMKEKKLLKKSKILNSSSFLIMHFTLEFFDLFIFKVNIMHSYI